MREEQRSGQSVWLLLLWMDMNEKKIKHIPSGEYGPVEESKGWRTQGWGVWGDQRSLYIPVYILARALRG